MDRFPIVLLCPGSPLRNIITPGRGRGGNVGVLGSLDRHLHMLLSPFLLPPKIIIGPKSDHSVALSVTESVLLLNVVQITGLLDFVKFDKSNNMSNFAKLLDGFVKFFLT